MFVREIYRQLLPLLPVHSPQMGQATAGKGWNTTCDGSVSSSQQPIQAGVVDWHGRGVQNRVRWPGSSRHCRSNCVRGSVHRSPVMKPNATDLFGQSFDPRNLPGGGAHKGTRPGGYAAPPGSGPEGQTCSTCAHYAVVKRSGTYRKCGLLRAVWTHGPGTDILARSPACSKWTPTR